jgi:hypothetical protein
MIYCETCSDARRQRLPRREFTVDRFLVERFVAEHAVAARGATVKQVAGAAEGLLLVLQTGTSTVELGCLFGAGAALVWWLGPEARSALLAELAPVAPALCAPLVAPATAPPGTTALDALRAWLVRPGPCSGEWSRLHGARLESLAAPGGDRIVELHFVLAAERATPQPAVLRAELFDPAGNLLLVAADGTTLANWRGRPAKPPRAPAPPLVLDAAALQRAVESERALRTARPDLDPLVARAAVAAAAGSASTLGDWLARYAAAPENLALQWASDGLVVHAAPARTGLGLAAAAMLGLSVPAAAALAARRARAARRHVERLERLVEQLEHDAEEARVASARRQEAELLSANLHTLRRGLQHVTVEDFFAAGKPRTIALDPALSPQENVARLYKDARRAARAHEPIASRLATTRAELATARDGAAAPAESGDWAAVLHAGWSAWSAACPAALRTPPAALWRAGGPPSAAPGKQPPAAAESRAAGPGRCFMLGDKWEVRVGRTNDENDLLTHRFAKPDDIWLHASGVPGSHVILRMQGRTSNPPREVLEAAAAIAARFSKAKHAGTVPVLWTRKRYVRKPRGAKPGLAACTHENTVFVRPGLPDGPAAD